MQKLDLIHLQSIESTRTSIETPKRNSNIILSSVAAAKSAEITQQIAIKFGNFLGQKCFWVNNAYYSYQNRTYTTEQLFEEFLKQYKNK